MLIVGIHPPASDSVQAKRACPELAGGPVTSQDPNVRVRELLSSFRLAPDEQAGAGSSAASHYAALIENLPVAFYRITPGPNPRLLIANRAFLDMLGLDRAQVQSQDAEAMDVASLTWGEIAESRVQFKKRDGTLIWRLVSARTVRRTTGEVAFHDCVARPIPVSAPPPPGAGEPPAPASRPTACAYLGILDDPTTRHGYPTPSNFCHAAARPREVELDYQADTCLKGEWAGCPRFPAAH
jgi:PAS domain-containing protein